MSERLTDARATIAASRVINSTERILFATIIDALEPLYRPPTEQEVDASLTRIGDADSVAMDTAAAAVRYVKLREQWGVRSLDDRDFADRLTAAYDEMKDATELFEEAMI